MFCFIGLHHTLDIMRCSHIFTEHGISVWKASIVCYSWQVLTHQWKEDQLSLQDDWHSARCLWGKPSSLRPQALFVHSKLIMWGSFPWCSSRRHRWCFQDFSITQTKKRIVISYREEQLLLICSSVEQQLINFSHANELKYANEWATHV